MLCGVEASADKFDVLVKVFVLRGITSESGQRLFFKVDKSKRNLISGSGERNHQFIKKNVLRVVFFSKPDRVEAFPKGLMDECRPKSGHGI